MSDESDLAAPAGPETVSTPAVAPQVEGPTDGQAAVETPEGEEAEKSESAKRRERDKAHKAQLRKDADEAKALAERADQRRLKVIEAGKSEKAPAEGEFTDYADYVAAKAVWTAEQRTTLRQAQALEVEAQEARQQAQNIEAAEQQIVRAAWFDRIAEAKGRYADFDAVVFGSVPITKEMAEVIEQSENGPDLAYWLGMNKAAAAEIAALSKTQPRLAAYHLGKLEASLSAPKPRTTSQAPEPITPTKGGGNPARDPSKMGFAEFKKYREAGGTI